MNSTASSENKKNNLEEEHKPQIIRIHSGLKTDHYAEINNSSFHFSLKCLNENYKKKIEPNFTNWIE